MRNLTFRLCVAILAFVLGVTATALWALERCRLRDVKNPLGQARTRSTEAAKGPTPPGWHEVSAKHLFTFYLPASMRLSSLERSVESVWGGTFSDERVTLYVEYGSWNEGYAPEYLAAQPEYRKELTHAGGKKAKFESWRAGGIPSGHKYTVEARIYGVDGGGNRIFLSASCKEESDVGVAKQIFRTVKLP